jgi:hypothetical protein
MTGRVLQIKIESGETTCASEPGKFCQFVGIRGIGTQYACRLFPSSDDSCSRLEDRDGWLQRLPECIESEESNA